MENTQQQLSAQIKVVLKLLRENYNENQRKGVLELIYKRYSNALQLLENDVIEKEKFHISGGVRAYLDSYSDYSNPLLNEMHKAEELVGKLFN
jgi:hypothetical protein